MAEVVRLGKQIELDLFLESPGQGQELGKFIRVTLTDANNDALPESPVSLTEFGSGRYFDDSITKRSGSVSALFEVFDDAGFTEKNTDYEDATERYIDPPFMTIHRSPVGIELDVQPTVEVEIGEQESLVVDVAEPETAEVDIEAPEDLTVENDTLDGLKIEIGD